MNNTLKTLTSIALLAGTAQVAHAHAGFKDPITEGTVKTWNAVSIGHGCASNAGGEGTSAQKDVIAISAIFPNSPNMADVIIRGSKGKPAVAAVLNADGSVKTAAVAGFTTGDETEIDKAIGLSKDIVGSTETTPLKAALSVITTGGTMFANTIPVIDGKGNVRGWQGWSGTSPFNGPALLESVKKADGTTVTTTGLSPFGINAFQFKPESCAKTLKIRVAVADWCEKGAKSYTSPSRVDLWIGRKTAKFNDDLVMANAGSNPIFWSTLTVNRDLARNPLPGTKGFNPDTGTAIDRTVAWDTGAKDAEGKAITSAKVSCAADTDYDTLYIEPTNEDIDTYLPISAAKYPVGANGALYWPTPVK